MRFWPKSPKITGLLLVSAIGLAVTLLTLETTPLEIRVGGLSVDQWCADFAFATDTKTWLIPKNEPICRLLFYDGPKILIIIFAVILGIALLLPTKLREQVPGLRRWADARRSALFMLLCIALIPVVCNRAKAVTNIYCPYQHDRYGGAVPYVRVFDSYPEEFQVIQKANSRERGRGFPAGHASGGFALMGIAFILPRRYFWLGLAFGSLAGWSMGLYQQLRGEHYLSHTLVTWCVAGIMTALFAGLVRPGAISRENKVSDTP